MFYAPGQEATDWPCVSFGSIDIPWCSGKFSVLLDSIITHEFYELVGDVIRSFLGKLSLGMTI